MKEWLKNRNLISGIGVLLMLAAPCAAVAADKQDTFPTPEKAIEALVFATRNDHTTELVKILGPESKRLVYSGDDVADNIARDHFIAAYDKAHKLEEAGSSDRIVLDVGEEEWPMPIPLIHGQNGWRFDTKSGQREILNRRIGRNELNVIEVCRAFVEAEHDYAADHPLSNGQHEFAQTIQSTDGKRDGLYWQVKDGEPESPLGPLIASATAEGYSPTSALDKRVPYHGYYYKILKAQGEHAAGGKVDYVVGGHMANGFALVAYPATYGDSGVMTFIVNQNGIVYETNLGPQTPGLVGHITEYDPDASWKIVH